MGRLGRARAIGSGAGTQLGRKVRLDPKPRASEQQQQKGVELRGRQPRERAVRGEECDEAVSDATGGEMSGTGAERAPPTGSRRRRAPRRWLVLVLRFGVGVGARLSAEESVARKATRMRKPAQERM